MGNAHAATWGWGKKPSAPDPKELVEEGMRYTCLFATASYYFGSEVNNGLLVYHRSLVYNQPSAAFFISHSSEG